MKIAFIHIVRTGGSSCNGHLMRDLPSRGYSVHNSWKTMNRDYDPDELREIAHKKGDVYVHNHAKSWTEPMVDFYHDLGWIFFTFIRPIGDQLCSMYWFKEQDWASDLDSWLRLALTDPSLRRHYEVPTFWHKINQVWHYGDMSSFLLANFDLAINEELHIYKTKNLGYTEHRRRGEISDETDVLIKQSKAHDRYRDVARQALTRWL